MLRALAVGSLLAIGILLSPPAAADTPPLLGLFEGHGIAPPADPARARKAIALAQRTHDLCNSLYQQRAGGTATAYEACAPPKGVMASLGPDAAAAILDVLDEPRRESPSGADTFSRMVALLADTGREDLVPILITALERMDARSALGNPRGSVLLWNHRMAIDDALGRLAYLEQYERSWTMGSSSEPTSAAIAGWRAWWQANKGKPRATWKAESLARKRARIESATGEAAIEAALVLAETRETKREGVAALKRIVRSEVCKQSCVRGRDFLMRLEPRGGWGFPGM